jgi:hypothetical protein
MQTKKYVIAGVAGAMLIAAGSLPASAQYAPYESCGDLYNRTLSTYHAYGPHSPQYAQILQYYNVHCMGASLPPPALVDPGAAIVGGIIGGVVGGALSGGDRDIRSDRRHDRRDDRRHHRRDDSRDDRSHRGDWRR